MGNAVSSELRVIEFFPPGVGVIAEGLGYFQDEDLRLSCTRTRSALEQQERLMSNQVDVALTAIDNLIAWNARGADLRVAAQIERTTLVDLITRAEIGAVADLRGKPVAVDSLDSGFSILMRKLLADQGLKESDYEMVSVGGVQERFDAVLAGQASAALLGPPWTGQATSLGLRWLLRANESLPALPGLAAVVRAARMDELRQPLHSYLRALQRACDWVAQTPTERVSALLEEAGFGEEGAADVLSVLPDNLRPSRVGIDLLFTMRREVGLLLEAGPAPEALLVQDELILAAWTESRSRPARETG